jgi:hypothetical protein
VKLMRRLGLLCTVNLVIIARQVMAGRGRAA